MPDYSEEIAYLEEIINSSVRDVMVDGTRAVYDFDAARKRLAELKTLQGSAMARPRVARLDLGNAW